MKEYLVAATRGRCKTVKKLPFFAQIFKGWRCVCRSEMQRSTSICFGTTSTGYAITTTFVGSKISIFAAVVHTT